MTKRLHIPLSDVVADERYQPRVEMDKAIVEEYAEQMKAGDVFPPIRVIRLASDGRYYIADGFHRYWASLRIKRKTIEAELIKDNGTHTDILLECVKANHAHGLRRTNADKHRAIEMILREPAFASLGKEKIAGLAHVSKPMVIDYIRKQDGQATAYERKKQQGSHNRTNPSEGVVTTPPASAALTKTQRAVMSHMTAAGTPQSFIDATLARWTAENAQRKNTQPKKRKSDIERLEALADKLARSKNVVIELAVKEATSRTKQYVKLPNSLKK